MGYVMEGVFDAIYVAIGNSDDKLTQREWGSFIRAVKYAIEDYKPTMIYGEWFSLPDVDYQNACFAFSRGTSRRQETFESGYNALKEQLAIIAKQYRQDSIVIVRGYTQFVKPSEA